MRACRRPLGAAFPAAPTPDGGRSLAAGVGSFVARLCALLVAAAPGFAASPAAVATLDCRNVSARDVAEVLASAPAPRILALHGSVPIVTMEPFAAFLQAMGYPEERLRHPVDGTRSLSSFVDARRFAGEIAWHYERDGLMPLVIGHSQGGMIVIKALHELAGRDGPVPVFNPRTGAAEPRTWVVDPATGARRPVTTLRVPFAAALVTGSLPRLLLAQWDVLPLLRDVPDSVVDFSGFSIPWDPIAGTGPDPTPYRATGTARVRNVVLPSSYSHIRLPDVATLAVAPGTRAWIDAWRPGVESGPPAGTGTDNLVHAAELWFSIKQHWCEAAKGRSAGPRS